MTHQYDWSKLTDGWRFMPRSHVVPADALVKTRPSGSALHFRIAELKEREMPEGLHTRTWTNLWPAAQAQLSQCRIGPDTRDWQALTEENERLKERVRELEASQRDWRDEVRQACEGVHAEGGFANHDFARGQFQGPGVVVHPMPGKMKLTCWDNRTMELDGDADPAGCLALSLVITLLEQERKAAEVVARIRTVADETLVEFGESSPEAQVVGGLLRHVADVVAKDLGVK